MCSAASRVVVNRFKWWTLAVNILHFIWVCVISCRFAVEWFCSTDYVIVAHKRAQIDQISTYKADFKFHIYNEKQLNFCRIRNFLSTARNHAILIGSSIRQANHSIHINLTKCRIWINVMFSGRNDCGKCQIVIMQEIFECLSMNRPINLFGWTFGEWWIAITYFVV